jgi:SAM-dependent methyltransferase
VPNDLALASAEGIEYVLGLYRLALRREPEPEVLADVVRRLDEGTLSRASLLRDLVANEEFERVRVLDDAVAFGSWARRNDERPRGMQAPGFCDERAIEIPWTLARYRGEPDVLDLGFALASPFWLSALGAAAPGDVVGVDLVAADVPAYRGIVADVRKLPLETDSFDVAFCVSTLEHVGADRHRGYRAGALKALRELRRVLRQDGRLLLTVPCGVAERHDGFVQQEPRWWLELFEKGGFSASDGEVYVCDAQGWHGAEHAQGARYDVARGRAGAVLCVELRPASAGERVGWWRRGVKGVAPS